MDYGSDVLASSARDSRRSKPAALAIDAELGMVVEHTASGYCGAIVEITKREITLEDRHNKRRVFGLGAADFLVEGRPAALRFVPKATQGAGRRTASGSVALDGARARVARASRIYVEGVHDAALVERVWGEDLRIEGIVVEPLHGVDDLPSVIGQFKPTATRRLGVLVDHLVTGSKERRIADASAHPHVVITGHPYVDIWQAVKPRAIGIQAWPQVPRGTDWKHGVCAALGVSDPLEMWRRVIKSVNSYADLETPLLGAMERLIDFVTDYPSA